MKNLFLVMLLAVFAFTSCSKDDGGDQAPLVLTGGTTTTQAVYADQTSGSGIKFAASAPWTANVTASKAGGSDLDWLTLNAYSGGAGEQTLTMTLKENLTGADRKAQISIVCGGTTITITVEQKGVTENGEKPEEPVVSARYITPEGKIAGGEIFGENLPTELKWTMMRMDDTSVDYYSPTSYPYSGQTFNITLPTPPAELLGAFVSKNDNTKDFTVVPSSAKFSHSVLDYDGGGLSLTNISWQDENNSNYKMKKGDGYVEFVYASEAVTVNGTIINKDDLTQQRTYQFTNCTFRQGWNEMVMIAESDATSNGPQIFNITTNNAPSTFKWIAQSYNFEPGVRIVSKITDWYNSNKEKYTQETTFFYDEKTRIIMAKATLVGVSETDFLDKYTWEYNGNTVVCKRTLFEKDGDGIFSTTATSTFSLNADGTIKSMVGKDVSNSGRTFDLNNTYTYTDGFMTQWREKQTTTDSDGTIYTSDQNRVITWKDGNVVREDMDEWYAKYEYNGTYDRRSSIDIFHITMKLDDMQTMPLNIGRRPQGLISKMTDYYGGDKEERSDYNYAYEYDNMGFIVKIKETSSDGSQNTTIITYGN